jgi:hypothetical protein
MDEVPLDRVASAFHVASIWECQPAPAGFAELIFDGFGPPDWTFIAVFHPPLEGVPA